LAENLNIPRPSVYDNLKVLIQNGLVVEKEEDNKKIFSVDNLNNLPKLIQRKIEVLQIEEKKITDALPNMIRQVRSVEPKIRFYSGVDGIKQVLRDLLWYKNINTITMWPISEMIDLLGKEYMEDLNRKRIKNKISIRGIWPKDKIIDFKAYPFMGVGKGFLRELRTAPRGMTWNMSYWIYEDKTAFISSSNETFGFVIQSKDFSDTMRAQFEVIWPLSKPIKAQPKYTDVFIKSL
jgi:sugar-specific transcriptional regulator TrmB